MNGKRRTPEQIIERLREGRGVVGVKTPYIEPGSPWENGYVESFDGTLRDELHRVRTMPKQVCIAMLDWASRFRCPAVVAAQPDTSTTPIDRYTYCVG